MSRLHLGFSRVRHERIIPSRMSICAAEKACAFSESLTSATILWAIGSALPSLWPWYDSSVLDGPSMKRVSHSGDFLCLGWQRMVSFGSNDIPCSLQVTGSNIARWIEKESLTQQ
jgi:hypothetical protein